MATSVVSALRWWAGTKGEQTALIVAEDEVSYRTLESWTSRFARRLAEAGIGPGDRVGLLGGNSLDWCVAALGILKTGAVLVPLNSRLVAPSCARSSSPRRRNSSSPMRPGWRSCRRSRPRCLGSMSFR